MPTFNSAGYLQAALSAIATQSYRNIELIVVDDGSTDDSVEIVKGFPGRVECIRQDNFGGPSRPRNVGVRRAKGELVAFCDSDDIWEPSVLADSVNIFQNVPQVDLTWADFRVIDGDGRPRAGSGLSECQEFRRDLKPTTMPSVYFMAGDKMYSALLRGLFLGISAVVVRKETLDRVGPFDETLRNSDDREMWMRIARLGCGFGFQDKVQFSYRRHENSVTRRGYLRYPSVISALERQLPFVNDPADRTFVQNRINSCRLGYAWGLRKAGRPVEAGSAYRAALAEKISLTGLIGLLLSWIMSLGMTDRRG